MKVNVFNTKNDQVGSIDLPAQFGEEIRVDLIRRAVLAIETNARQRYGADPEAGKKHVTNVRKRRRRYRASYGLGISRSPRKIMSRNGTRFNWVGALASNTRGGRVSHPPKAEKIWEHKVNVKERRKAIRAAMSATIKADLVAKRGHKVPKAYPFVIDNDFEAISKTKNFVDALEALGLEAELTRSATTKTKGGAAARRGRRIKRTVGPLVVVSKSCAAVKAARNIPGIEVVSVKGLNAKVLAPGTHVGRLTLYTKGAIETIAKEGLFQ